MNLLPNELIIEVLGLLTPFDLIKTSKCSKILYDIIINQKYFDFSKCNINRLLWVALHNNDIKFISWLYQNKCIMNKDLILSYSLVTSNGKTIIKLLKNDNFTIYQKKKRIGYEMMLLELRYHKKNTIFEKINFVDINWLKKYKYILTNNSKLSVKDYLIIKGCLRKKLRKLIFSTPRKRLISMSIDLD